MFGELLVIFNSLPGPLQAVCSAVGLQTVKKLVDAGIDEVRGKNAGVVFARVCKQWQRHVAADTETLATTFQEFFARKPTLDEMAKVLRADYVEVDFDVLEQQLQEAGEWAACPVQSVNVVESLAVLFEDLSLWLEELPEFRARYSVPLRKSLEALHGPENSIPNHSLARRRYLDALVREHSYVKFLGTAELGGPTEIGIRQVYVTPRLLEQGRLQTRTSDEEPEPISARELVANDQAPARTVVLGAPGSGKSTLGQWLTLALASGKLQAEGDDANTIGLVPVFYRIRYLKEDLAEVSKTVKTPTLWDCLLRRASQITGPSLPAGFLQTMDRQRGLLVFFDGLDEAASQTQAVSLISGFAGGLSAASRVIVTSRPFEYRQHFSPKSYSHFELQEFDEGEIREFIDKWREARQEDKEDAARKAEQLWSSLEHRPEIRGLAGNALLLTMIVRVHFWLGTLPDSRVELYEKCADTLLKHWSEAAELGRGPLDRDEKILFLSRLAFDMQTEQEEKMSEDGVPLQIEEADLRKRLRGFLKEEKPGASVDEVVRRLQARDAILVDYGSRQFGFVHRSFQEYFAAWWMKEELEGDDLREYEDRSPWRETYVMAVAQLENRRRRKLIVDQLLRNRADLASECVRAGKNERWLDVLARYLAKYYTGGGLDLTAGVCADACSERSELPKVLEAIFDRENRDGRSLAAAVELAEELAKRGDDTARRLLESFWKESAEYGLDSTEDMVLVEGGPFPYQDGESIPVATFRIGRYPVTNRDYERMVPAHRAERSEYSDQDDQPVIEVSWLEAQLYCRWRGAEFRLPTEQEWEKAAFWDPEAKEKREYPWKGKFDSKLCNTREGRIGKTTPVGAYPKGASAYGCEDMAGNVWELCLNEFHNPDRTGLEGSEPRVLRGGSWDDFLGSARAVILFYDPPDVRLGGVGFRVACSSPIR